MTVLYDQYILYGLPRSGTNVLEYILWNIDSKNANELGSVYWKHNFPLVFSDTLTILIYKPLCAWLYSISKFDGPTYRWFYKDKIDFHDTIKAAEFWGLYYQQIKSLEEIPNTYTIHYDDLLKKQEKIVGELQELLSGRLRGFPQNTMNRATKQTKSRFNADFYKTKEYLASDPQSFIEPLSLFAGKIPRRDLI